MLRRAMSSQVLNISKDRDSTTPLANLFQSLTTFTVEKVFLMFKQNFLWLGLCPLPPVLSLDATEKSLSSYSLLPSHQVFTHMDESSLSLLLSRLNSPSSLSLSCMSDVPVL